MGGETERLEREINAYLTGLPGFDLDVYRDIFSSEYVNNVIYNHPGSGYAGYSRCWTGWVSSATPTLC